jgi:hypothetical protein
MLFASIVAWHLNSLAFLKLNKALEQPNNQDVQRKEHA